MTQTIGLCMIVRDESAVIERCLDSVRPLIDTWTICDTGSVDGTPAVIEAALEGIPGQLHHRPWVDFGHNRSDLADLAYGSADYLLLVDADMTVIRRDDLPALDADAYMLRHSGDLAYSVPRLIRGSRRWWYEGATHEYLATEGEYTQEFLEALVVEHHADGASRAGKYERDRRLLSLALERDPHDARATFYLGQTLRDLGDIDGAIDAYRRRVALGGWEEEVFYAAFQAGVLTGRTDADAAIPLLLAAFDMRPSRAETLHELARLSRLRSHHQSAYLFACAAAQLPVPDDVLFVHRDVYEWGARFEQAIAAHWVGKYDEALDLNAALLSEGRMPPAYAAAAERNRNHALRASGQRQAARPFADVLANLVGDLAHGEIVLDVDPRWPQFNPSIATDGDGFRMTVRTSNYRIDTNGRYDIDDPDGIVRSINYLVELDHSISIDSISGIHECAMGPPAYDSLVVGWEDLRLIKVQGCWFATATARDRNPDGRAEVALLKLDGPAVVDSQVLRGPFDERYEKNWMPFVRDGRLHLVYSCDPTVIFQCHPATGALSEVAHHDAVWAADLRGGSAGVRVAEGWLFVVHEVFDAGRREYLHRLILLDGDFRLSAASPRFSFGNAPIEMCIGLAAAGDRLIFTYGENDASAHIAVCELEAALELLEPRT